MTMLITGGAGFIGSNFIFYIMKKYPDRRIVCVDKLTYAGNLSTLEPILSDPRFCFVQGDICDRDLIDRVFSEEHPDVVVNFAAESHVDRSIEDPEVFLRTNVLGTGVLLDASRKYGVKRFHQISTDEVYGDLPLDSDNRFTEASPLCPSSPYSASKASADLLTLSYFRTYGLPATVSRSSNNYGSYQFPEKLIPLMIANALSDKPLPVYGDGLNVRNWLYVEDHCAAVDLILQKGKPGEVYNVGSSDEICNLELIRRLLRLLGKGEELIIYVADRKGHDRKYSIDSEKLRRELGWTPRTDFSEGLERTVRWYLESGDWWRPLWKGGTV
ncbi:MAG: dTDP-glucose 4,6-dehydratase [Clostridia bacterium]|nr:dTDP-glucose 4,6-dehydratase [Clostridia bacterium]